jgi:hypothetical protein
MKHEVTLALHAYWQSCQGDDGVRPTSMRAAELAPLLPFLFLVDINPPAEPRFRFCGAALAMRYGRDLTDEAFLPMWSAQDRSTLLHDLKLVAAGSAGLVAGVMAETVGGGFTSFELLLGGHEETNRIRARILAQWLRSTRFLSARINGHAPSLVARFVPTDFAPPPRRRYGHLTVLSGGK